MTKEYHSTKTYTHAVGLSCCFRQWRAESHCKYLHGYALQIGLEFAAEELDIRGWVVDFGALKTLRGWFEDLLDHRTLVAEDDPELGWFQLAEKAGIARLRIVPATGCEMFAEYIFGAVDTWLHDNGYSPRVHIYSVEVREHAGNSAIYRQT